MTKLLSLISFLVNPILSWTPRGTTCLPRGTTQIALFSIGIHFNFSAFLASDLSGTGYPVSKSAPNLHQSQGPLFIDSMDLYLFHQSVPITVNFSSFPH